MARPPKYNPDRHKRAIDVLRAGNTRRAAAWAAGIDQNTIMDWIRRYPDFADAVKEAEAEAELAMVQRVRTAADDSWQAAAWWLERKMKQDWSARQEQTGADGGAVQIRVRFEDKEPELAEVAE